MRTLARAYTAYVVALGTLGCGDDVPIGRGNDGVVSDGGNVGGAAGSSSGGLGGAGGSGAGGSGGAHTGGGGGLAGSGGSGGTSGSGGATSCPVQTSNLIHQIAAPDVHDVLVVGSDVYFSQGGETDGMIRRAPLATGVATDFATLAIDSATPKAFQSPDSLTTDGTNLLWRSQSGKSVWKKPLSGGPSAPLVELSSNPFPPNAGLQGGLATGGGKVFWVEGPHSTGPTSVTYKIFSAPLGGGAGTELLAYDSGSTADVPFMPLSLLADASGIYFSLWSGGGFSKTVKAGLDGSNPTEMFDIGQQLADAGANVLLTSGGFAWRLPKAGGAPEFTTQGLDQATVFAVSQGIAESQGETYVSLLGTIGTLECCSCGWIYSVPTTANLATPTVVWAGIGRPTAVSAGGGYVVSADIDNDEVLVLQP